MSVYGQPGPFPFEPLEHAVRRIVGEDATDRSVASTLRCSAASLRRYRTGLNDRQADRLAIRLGMHPAAVWGDLWWQGTWLLDDVQPIDPVPAKGKQGLWAWKG